MASAPATQNPRYEPDERPPLRVTLGLGLQFSFIASATLLITPVIVAQASDEGDAYLVWMVFASLLVVGISTLLQVRRLGPVGAGSVLPMATAPFAIPFCITAVTDGGPGTLMALTLVTAVVQIAISRWLFILRRVVTPTVGGTVMMILSITLSSVVFGLLDDAAEVEPVAAPLTALVTLVVVAVLLLRGNAVLRLWAPVIGIVIGCLTAAALGIYEPDAVRDAAWIGPPTELPDLGLDFGVAFWTLIPAFLVLGVIISIQVNGESITKQRVSWRDDRAVDFREVQGALSGGGVANLLAGMTGAVPNIINAGIISFTQVTGVAARTVGYCIGVTFIVVAFLPKVSGLLSTIPGPVMTGYLIMVTGTLFVEGARTVIQNEQDRQKLTAAGVAFWLGAAFQFDLFTLPDAHPILDALLSSGVSTGGLAIVVMVLFLELTGQRRMRFRSQLDIDALPDLNAFMGRFAGRNGWDAAMVDRLNAVSEETLLTLAPLDFDLDLDLDAEDGEGERRLVVVASRDGDEAELEFISGGNEENVEDRIRQLQQHDSETPVEREISLQLLQHYASSVSHQQYHDAEVITVRVIPPDA